jgi:hypothetical protein
VILDPCTICCEPYHQEGECPRKYRTQDHQHTSDHHRTSDHQRITNHHSTSDNRHMLPPAPSPPTSPKHHSSQHVEYYECDFCGSHNHRTSEHRCAFCVIRGHKSKYCPRRKTCHYCGSIEHKKQNHRCGSCGGRNHESRKCSRENNRKKRKIIEVTSCMKCKRRFGFRRLLQNLSALLSCRREATPSSEESLTSNH